MKEKERRKASPIQPPNLILRKSQPRCFHESSAFTAEYDVVRSAATHLQYLTVATAHNHHHTACAGQEQDSVLPAALEFMVRGAQ